MEGSGWFTAHQGWGLWDAGGAQRGFGMVGRALCGILQWDEEGMLPPMGAVGALG